MPGAGSAKPQASPAVAQQSPQAPQSALDRASLSQSMDKAASSPALRESMRQMKPSSQFEQSPQPQALPATPADKAPNQIAGQQQPNQPQLSPQKMSPARSSPPGSSNPGLSQSFDQRSILAMQQQSKVTAEGNSPNALRTSVDVAINNVDRALLEMHKQEVDRLKTRIDVSFRQL